MEGNLLWIKIRFKQHIPAEVIDNVNCTINCFPAINRRSEKVYINGKDKIAALISENNEMFFDLKSIEPEGNMRVLLSSDVSDDKQIENTGLLTLRQDNIGRFNSRNALELIEQMIDVYREEFMAFSKFKNINQDSVEDLNNAIQQITEVIRFAKELKLHKVVDENKKGKGLTWPLQYPEKVSKIIIIFSLS